MAVDSNQGENAMKKIKTLCAICVMALLTACDPFSNSRGLADVPAETQQPVVQQQQQSGVSPLAAGAIGAAAGYMMGRSSRPAVAPAPVPAPVIVKKTIIVNKNYTTPRPSFSSPRAPSISSRGRR
jgi:hypothetical protein